MPYAFEDSFTDTNGTVNSTRTGWTGGALVCGSNIFQINSNTLGQVNTAVGICAYSIGADDRTRIGFSVIAGWNGGAFICGSGTDGSFNAYAIWGNGGDTLRVQYITNGSTAGLADEFSTGVGNLSNLEVESENTGSAIVIRVYQNGSLIRTVTDSSGDRKTGTASRGLLGNGFSGTMQILDNWKSGYSEVVDDTTPDPFSFTDQTDVARSTTITSNAITVAGIDAAAAISVDVGEYRINGGSWTSTAGTVTVGQTVEVRHTSSALFSTTVNQVLTIGGVTDTFSSTTVASETANFTITVTDSLGATATLATSITTGPAASGGGGDVPISVLSAEWSRGVEATTVYALSSTANSGPRTTPTKLVGVDSLPSDATIVGSNVTLAGGGAGGTLSGWSLQSYGINVTGNGWLIEDCEVVPANGSFTGIVIQSAVVGTEIGYCTVDGEYGASSTDDLIYDNGYQSHVHHNRLRGGEKASIKQASASATTGNRSIYEYNYFEGGGGWASPSAHFDPLHVLRGACIVRYNYFDAQFYSDPSVLTGDWIPPVTPSPEPGVYTYGMSNILRFQAFGSGAAIDNIEVYNNIIVGGKRGVYEVIAHLEDGGTCGTMLFDENIVEEGLENDLFRGGEPDGTVTFTGNTRWSDGAAFTDKFGGTDVVPSAPVIDSADTITSSSFRLIYDRAGDASSHQYELNGGAATSLGSPATIGGLSSGSTNSVRIRGVNAHGNGPWSNALEVTTS